jgi:dipeptidyl aminopeptidase/acylaminoacyl peptidase
MIKRLALAIAAMGMAWTTAAAQPVVEPEVWADTNNIQDLDMSPNGRRIAMLQRLERGDFHRLVVFDTDDIEDSMTVVNLDEEARPFQLFWKGDDRLVLSVAIERERAGDPITVIRHLALNPNDTSDVVDLLDAGSANPRSNMAQAMAMLSNGFIASAQIYDPDHVIMGLVTDANGIPDYYKVNVRTGERTRVLRGNDRYSGFGFDWDGEARYAQTYEPDGPRIVNVVRLKGETDWIPVGELDANARRRFSLIGFLDPERPNTAVIVTDTPGDDTQAMFELNVETGERNLIVQEPGFEPRGIIRSPWLEEEGRVIGFVYANGTRAFSYVYDETWAPLYNSLEATFPDRNVSVVRVSNDRAVTLVYTSGPTDPGTYYLLRDGAIAPIIRVNTEIPDEALSPVEERVITARDGRQIPVLVTRPRVDGPAPGIALPHGGPWARDDYGYDEWAQLLANRGWVVVQANFRGSAGLGRDHWIAGDNEWGQAMQDDVEDAMLALVDEGVIDRDRMGIFGWSFGGYTAFTAATRNNDLFNCSAAGAGVADIGRIRGGLTGSRYLRRFQQPTISGWNPLEHADSVRMPMLVVHGDADNTVPVLHSRLFVDALQRNGVPHEYIEIENMRHSPFYYDQNIQWFPQLIEFFETQCGF